MPKAEKTSIQESAIRYAKSDDHKKIYLKSETTRHGIKISIKSTEWPRIHRLWTSIKSLFTKKTTYIYGDEFVQAMKDKKFKQIEVLNFYLENIEYGHLTPLQKFQRAARNAAKIGKGLVEMKKRGVKGKVLYEEYWIEALGREHQAGYKQKDKFKEWEKSETELSYFEWEQLNYGNKEIEKSQSVTYLTPTERVKYEISFSQSSRSKNLRLLRNGEPFSTENETSRSKKGTAIFVISAEDKLYSGSSILGQFHHSSFLAGEAISGAGEIRTNQDGEIVWISDKSGHYRSGKNETINILNYFNKKGVDLSRVNFYNVVNNQTYNAKQHLTDLQKLDTTE